MITFAATFLILLPLLVCQWLGVVGLAKPRRDGAWWMMLAGAALSSVGALASSLMIISITTGRLPMEKMAWISMGVGSLGSVGSLAFMIGFAMHGWKTRKMWQRIEDLEGIVAAQNEQLSRKDER